MTNIVPTPQKNPISAPQQDADVMALVKSKGKPKQGPAVEKAKEQLKQVILQNKLDPQVIIRSGKIASAALRDPKMYQIAIQTAIKENLIDPKDVKGPGIDYKLLANGITAGKLTQELVNEGLL